MSTITERTEAIKDIVCRYELATYYIDIRNRINKRENTNYGCEYHFGGSVARIADNVDAAIRILKSQNVEITAFSVAVYLEWK